MRLLGRIARNTSHPWWESIWRGLLYGAAFTLGSVFIIAIAGWALSVIGVIPGLGDIASYLHGLIRAHG